MRYGKDQVKNPHIRLKQACSESDLYDRMDVVEKLESEIKVIRQHTAQMYTKPRISEKNVCICSGTS